MVSLYNQTEGSLIFRFTGANEIEIKDFIKSLEATSKIIEEIAKATDENVYLSLKITAIEKGSFIYNLKALTGFIAPHIPIIVDNALKAQPLLSSMIEYLKIRQWIGKDEIKSFENSKGTTTITKVDGDKNVITNNITTNIFLNPKKLEIVDKICEGFVNSIPNGRDIEIKSESEFFKIDENMKHILKTPIAKLSKNKKDKYSYRRNVTIKKPDLEMTSKWVVITDKQIYVEIVDDDFIEKVLNREFKCAHGDILNVELEEEKELDKKGNILEVKYRILKVYEHGEQLEIN